MLRHCQLNALVLRRAETQARWSMVLWELALWEQRFGAANLAVDAVERLQGPGVLGAGMALACVLVGVGLWCLDAQMELLWCLDALSHAAADS